MTANHETELRNWIYEDLLTLQDSFSCFPQILCTSREVNTEATGILYAENYIDIKIYPDGVFAHGRRCGSYVPIPSDRRTSGTAFTAIVWPDFLRRARFLRVIAPANSWAFVSAGGVRNGLGDCVGNTIYSLCNMLHQGNELLSVRVVMQPDVTSTFESMQSVLYPLRLLGPIQLEMVDNANHSLANFYSSSENLIVAPTAVLGQVKLIYDCVELISWLRQSPWAASSSNSRMYRTLTHAVSTARYFTGNFDDRSPVWEQAFRKAILELRTDLETRGVLRTPLNPTLLFNICGMLRLEVDLTVGTFLTTGVDWA